MHSPASAARAVKAHKALSPNAQDCRFKGSLLVHGILDLLDPAQASQSWRVRIGRLVDQGRSLHYSDYFRRFGSCVRRRKSVAARDDGRVRSKVVSARILAGMVPALLRAR